MEENKKSVTDNLKKGPLAKLHERIQNKYMEMQRKLAKSKSVDCIATLNDDYSVKENRHSISSVLSEKRFSSNSDLGEIKELKKGELNFEMNTCIEKHDIVIEHVKESVAIEEFLEDEESIFEGQLENDNDFLSPLPFYDSDFRVSTDS